MMSPDVLKQENRKLLVLDMDGTLLTDDKSISDTTSCYLKKAKELGTIICLATGRVFEGTRDFLLSYNMEGPVICANGALIKDSGTMHEYFKKTIRGSEADRIVKYCLDQDILLHVFTEDEWYVSKIESSVIEYAKNFESSMRKPEMTAGVKDWGQKGIIKMVMVDNPEKINSMEIWAAQNGIDLNLVRSDPYSLDITHKEASKGNAVRVMAGILGIEKQDIIAVGNYYNDIGMFNAAGMGIAVANSPDEVKRKADFVVKSNEEDGVAEVIKKFILKIS